MGNKQLLIGVTFIAISLAFGLGGFAYTVGTPDDAGPGFFPLVVSVSLGLLGVCSVIKSFFNRDTVTLKLRNLAIITASLLAFAVATEYINIVVGIVLLVITSSFASEKYSIKNVVLISAGLVVVAYLFKYLLGLNLPL